MAALAVEMDSGKEHLFSAKFSCPVCSYSLPELEPRLFSFNNPMGACPKCDGLGQITFFDPKRIVAFPASVAWLRARSRAGTGATSSSSRCCKAWRMHYGFDLETTVRTTCPEISSRFCSMAAATKPLLSSTWVRRGGMQLAQPSVRGHHHQSGAALPRNRFAHGARGTGQIPQLSDLPRLRGHPAARRKRVMSWWADKAIFEISRLPLKQALDFFRDAGHSTARNRPSPNASSRKSQRGYAFSTMSGWITCRWTARPIRFPAARRSASAWPARSAPD